MPDGILLFLYSSVPSAMFDGLACIYRRTEVKRRISGKTRRNRKEDDSPVTAGVHDRTGAARSGKKTSARCTAHGARLKKRPADATLYADEQQEGYHAASDCEK